MFGRAIAHAVSSVTAVDITPEMIEQGRKRTNEDGILNLEWQLGSAEALPFADESFDVVMSRYAIHHFADPKAVLKEMSRVCKTGGLVVNVDMVANENSAVATYQNAVERMIDTTHTSMLSPSQLVQVTTNAGLTMRTYLSREVRVKFDEWQPHVSTRQRSLPLTASRSRGRTFRRRERQACSRSSKAVNSTSSTFGV